MSLSPGQLTAIEITERVSSVLSLLGTTFIIATFLSDNAFHRPINRLVFYAAWGNVVTNVATLIGVSGVHFGGKSPLCQFQAFIIQMFMPADALWTFAMACNVYLTFFHKYDAEKLRTLEPYYLTFCYGLPFIPAFAYCFVETASRGKVYGPAVLWCWVSLDWDALRIATFYGPVWVVIIATFSIYVCAGMVVFKWRDQLVNMAHNQDLSSDTQLDDRELEPVESTTKVIVQKNNLGVWVASPDDALDERSQEKLQVPPSPNRTNSQYYDHRSQSNASIRELPTSDQANKAAINYCKCAVLFFIALLVTWVPSTINRVYTLVHPHSVVFGLDFASGLVLPLQGFWNAFVYIVTSFPACRAICSKIMRKAPRREKEGTSKSRGCLSRGTESTENLTET